MERCSHAFILEPKNISKVQNFHDPILLWRLYHQEHSQPLLERMKGSLLYLVDQRLIEPNSPVGKAVRLLSCGAGLQTRSARSAAQ
jgi:hypothetical protein